MTTRYGLRITTSAILLLAAIGCAVALNLVDQPHPGWPAEWIILLAGALTLGLCGVTVALDTIWRALAPFEDDARG